MSSDPATPTGRARRTPIPAPARRTIFASFLGSTFEWYDFGIYGTTSAIVFNQVFFPGENAALGTLLALTTVAVGFITRPIGGIIFGHFGDRVGRKRLLVLTMLIMGVPTFMIGLLPSYASIGIAAPILLLVMRLAQGIGLGGEYAGASLAAIESVPADRRGLVGSIPQIGNPFGGVLGTLLVLAATTFGGDEAFAAGLWRVPFLFSAVLLVYAMVVRLRLVETGDFHELVENRGVEASPLLSVIRHHAVPLLLGIGARCADAITGNVAGTVVVAYVATYLGGSNSLGLTTTVIPSVLAIPLMLAMGMYSDRIGRKQVFVLGMVALAVTVFPMFALLNTRVLWLMVLGVTVFRLCNSTQFAVQSAFLADIFPTEVRYTAVSLVYQVSAIVGGLTAPACMAVLIATHGSPWLLCMLITAAIVLSILCALAMRSRVRPGSMRPVVA